MRLTTPRGADHPRARFTPEEVVEIRKSYQERPRTYTEIAKEKGCCRDTITELLNNRSYRQAPK